MPALGPKSNFVLLVVGRGTEGRGEFFEGFFYGTIGSANFLVHADVCQWPKWAAFDRPHVGPDIKSAQYVVAWGCFHSQSLQPSGPSLEHIPLQKGQRRPKGGLDRPKGPQRRSSLLPQTHKLDDKGNVVWQKTIPFRESAKKDPDGKGNYHAWVVKFDKNGKVEWENLLK